jgi:hypothetical protein
MPFQLAPDQVTRLALARYLLQHAETVAKNPQPLSSLALLSAHDAIKMVLDVLAEVANASIATGRDFNSFWSGLKNAPNTVHLLLERPMGGSIGTRGTKASWAGLPTINSPRISQMEERL